MPSGFEIWKVLKPGWCLFILSSRGHAGVELAPTGGAAHLVGVDDPHDAHRGVGVQVDPSETRPFERYVLSNG